jgi:hypothetical protein
MVVVTEMSQVFGPVMRSVLSKQGLIIHLTGRVGGKGEGVSGLVYQRVHLWAWFWTKKTKNKAKAFLSNYERPNWAKINYMEVP